jgi:hypothetical protein
MKAFITPSRRDIFQSPPPPAPHLVSRSQLQPRTRYDEIPQVKYEM